MADGKTFSLKPIEKQMLQTLDSQHFTIMSNFLTFIALERLAYAVTENTRYAIDGDTLVITEQEPPKEEVATAADNTKDALK